MFVRPGRAAKRAKVAGRIGNRVSSAESAYSACRDRVSPVIDIITVYVSIISMVQLSQHIQPASHRDRVSPAESAFSAALREAMEADTQTPREATEAPREADTETL